MKRYDEEFRKDAVEMLINGDRSIRRLARELGVSPQTLHNWWDAYFGKKDNHQAEGMLGVKQTYDELRRLRTENVVLKRQRDILKKALSILSEPPAGGMC